MNKFNLFLFGVFALLMIGCIGEARNIGRQGVYSMRAYQWSKLKEDGTYTSIVNSDNYFDSFIFWNNGEEEDNDVTYEGNFMINSWAACGIKASHKIKWYPRGENQVVVWSENEDGSRNICIHTIEERTWKGDIWTTTVNTDEGTFKEEIEF